LDSNSIIRLNPPTDISRQKGQTELQQYESSLTPSRPLEASRAAALSALFIAGFATFINLYATQPLLPEFRRIFSASELMVSLTVSAPVLAVMLTAPLIGLLADATGRKRVIVAAILGLAVTTALTATAANLYQLIIWRFLQGLFVPGIIAVAMAYISEESPSRSVGSTMAIYVTGTVVGGFSGRFIAGIIAHHWGWRAPFVVLGALTLAGAFATWRILPRARKFVPQNSAAALLGSLLSHLRNPQLLATFAVGSSVLCCMVAAFTYVNFYLADKPFYLGPAALAMIFAVYLIGAAVTPVAGRILDRVGYRRGLMGAAGILATGMLLTLIHYVPVIIGGLAIAATGVFICQAAASSNVGKAAGIAGSSATGLYVAFYYFGGFAGSILPGFFWKQTGWSGCVAIIICIQMLAALIAYRFWKN
jgi:MFS transporter, YNFM family, putative membrane transport protein